MTVNELVYELTKLVREDGLEDVGIMVPSQTGGYVNVTDVAYDVETEEIILS